VHVVNETTIKLYRIHIRCIALENMDCETGAYTGPYFETDVGVGFSGYCTEALTIIATITRCLEGLASASDQKPMPDRRGVVGLIETVVERYFRKHSQPTTQVVDFLVCGYHEGTPWLAQISHRPQTGVKVDWLPLGSDDFYVIGNIVSSDPKYKLAIDGLKVRIAKHKADLRNVAGTIEGHFDLERESARHDVAKKKMIERETLSRVFDPFVQGVGGVLQKMEVYGRGAVAQAVFTKDARPYLVDGLPVVGGDSLGVIPIVEHMG
jgi:hypothetical protein